MLNKGKDHVVNRNIVTEVQEVYRFKECENNNSSNIAVFACNNTDKGNDDDGLKTLISENITLLSVLIPRLNNKQKVELFIQLYTHYYLETPSYERNCTFNAKNLNTLIDNVPIAHNIINGDITIIHAINILNPQ